MRKLLFISILFTSLFSCTHDQDDPVVTPPVVITPPTPGKADVKPAIVNITSGKRLTSKTAVIDSTRQRLIYTTRLDIPDTTFYRYDNKGRLIKVEKSTSVLRTFAYDDNDVMTKYTNPSHYLTYCSFDSQGRVIGSHSNATDLEDNETQIKYDESGRVQSITHRNGQKQSYEYDANNTFFIVHYFLNNEEYLSQKNWYDNHKPGTYSVEKHNLYDPAKYMYVEFYQSTNLRTGTPILGDILSTERLFNKYGYLIQGYDQESNNVLKYVYEYY